MFLSLCLESKTAKFMNVGYNSCFNGPNFKAIRMKVKVKVTL